jgi:hypothetical protein
MRKDIVVADEEISIAQRGITTRCAIAAAIMRQVPDARYIKVTKDTISYLDVNRQLRFKFRTPPTAVGFIRRWDAGEKVSPIGFSLTEAALISCRPPRMVKTKQRVERNPHPVIQHPGIRMIRHPDDNCSVN